MPLILHIDTATENAIVCISKNEDIIHVITNGKQKDHASFLQPAIKRLLEKSNISIHQLNAVSVTSGPGSYTGLRVGMASAKGFCYALKIPLITLNTLEVMALSVIEGTNEPGLYLYCPMIDARRMEVFTAIFDDRLNEIQPPCAIVLEQSSFDKFTQQKQIIFCGSGAKKFIDLSPTHSNFIFNQSAIAASALVKISAKKLEQEKFAEVSTAEPMYIKDFILVKNKIGN